MRYSILVCLIGISSLPLFTGCEKATAERELASSTASANTSKASDTKLVAVKVTGMMCPHNCFKDVKSIITKRNQIESIELTPQKEPDTIDNPVVLVKYRGDLDRAATTKAILDAGFEKVEYTDQ